MKKIIACMLFLILLLLGCSDNSESIINKLYYRKIDYISDNQLIMKDTTINRFIVEPSIKIVTYFDSLICTQCLMNYLNTASKYIERFNNDSVIFICVLQSSRIDELQNALKQFEFNNVLIINDKHDNYLKKNGIDNIPMTYTSFLLDYDNIIALIGDPLKNSNIRLLYNRRIGELINNNGRILTSEKSRIRNKYYSK